MCYRLIGSLLLCLFSASMFAAKFSANTSDLRVSESATKFSLQKEGAIVRLALENTRAGALPAQIKLELINPREAEEAEVKVVAELGGFYQEAKEEVGFLYPNQILVSTDKPLYQPGQTLHIRILGLDRDRKAWADTEGTLKIRDPEGSYIFRSGFKTSRFGVASVDWPVPDNARLGDYDVEAWLSEESSRH